MCAATSDGVFLAALGIPVFVLVTAAVLNYMKKPPDEAFKDPETGMYFEAQDGAQPERDAKGQLAFRPISFTPWPVDESYEGERVRIPVGKINDRQPRTFVFNRLLGPTSEIVVVSLPRPLGIVFDYDERFKRTVVLELMEGGNAAQQQKVASLQGVSQQGSGAVRPGDVLRAFTAPNMVYPTNALFGAVPPERHIVMYGADKQAWANVSGALRRGKVKDGPVTLVFERRRLLEPDTTLMGASAQQGGSEGVSGAGASGSTAAV